MTMRMMTNRTTNWTAYITTHGGHVYVNGIHWLRSCPLCQSLLAKAEVVASGEEGRDG